ncbi:MAG: hypothetical protein CM1200mP3_17090 [Chloroflexota bacterium]|nr:MAG: hypothetical protein CM1200mP3_17090 [Chloroflexota bacterium]
MSAVYGRKVSTEFLSINPFDSDFSDEGLSVTGIISTPAETRANRSHINVFVNGRWVEDKTIAFAFIQSYHGFIQRGKFPMGLLDIRIPESDVDVNVHPAKTEVRFKNENQVFALVQKNVRQTLVQYAQSQTFQHPLRPRLISLQTLLFFGQIHPDHYRDTVLHLSCHLFRHISKGLN